MSDNGVTLFGKVLISMGLVMILLGILLIFGPKMANLFRLPGDINIERENFRFYFPIMTSLLISVILTILLNVFWLKK